MGNTALATVSADGVIVRRWYALPRPTPSTHSDERAAAVDLRERFDAAVADRLVADVPVGAFLSGGIDSSLVAASATRCGDRPNFFCHSALFLLPCGQRCETLKMKGAPPRRPRDKPERRLQNG